MKWINFDKNRERRGLEHGLEEVVHQPNLVGLHGGSQVAKEKASVFAPTFSTSLDLVSDILGLTLWLRSP